MFVGRKILLLFVLLHSLVVGAFGSGCLCQPIHPQKDVCDHDFVLRVWVQTTLERRENETNGYRFSVWVIEIYKGNITELIIEKGTNIELALSPFCGYGKMNTEQEWLIFGIRKGGLIYTETCSGSRLWLETTSFMRSSLDFKYQHWCPCMEDFDKHTDSRRLKRDVDLFEFMNYGKCEYNYSLRKIAKSDGVCVWDDNEEYRACLAQKNE